MLLSSVVEWILKRRECKHESTAFIGCMSGKSSPAAVLELTSHIVSPPSFGAAHRFRKDRLTS